MPLARRLAAFPRVRLGQFPTPLEPLPRLWVNRDVKRDAAVGPADPALSGHKTRKLECA